MGRKLVLLCAVLALSLSLAAEGQAPAPPQPVFPKRKLRVATRVLPPFVIDNGGSYSGFSIELWEAIAARLGLESELLAKSNVKDLLSSVQSAETDLGISAVSITSERDRSFDFSQPMFDSGLQILVPDNSGGKKSDSSTFNFFATVTQPSFLRLLLLMVVLTIVFAHLAWLAERRHECGLVSSTKYFPGIFFSLWWSAGTLGAQADEMPKTAWGRLIAVIWMFGTIIFVAYFTAALTTQLTVQQLQGGIRGPDDLPGKRIATVRNSTSARYLTERRARLVEFEKIEEAFGTLLAGRAEAVVYDSPVLLYYANHEGKGRAQVVGGVFRKEDYGIVFRSHSAYRKPINTALLALKEDGTYDRIYDRWFGENR
jgi:polar amino acid transport system substrate-binding protein